MQINITYYINMYVLKLKHISKYPLIYSSILEYVNMKINQQIVKHLFNPYW